MFSVLDLGSSSSCCAWISFILLTGFLLVSVQMGVTLLALSESMAVHESEYLVC